ncbi:hypothetical protein [Clostridium sp. UBA3887]|uniref:hypothetical protein n=1 Tax=Clostridium sp. UBA3887 TaxID=1946356 RepID=UPI0032170A58
MNRNVNEILRKKYETSNEFVIEVLEDSEDKYHEELLAKMPEELKHTFNKYTELLNHMFELKVELAYENGISDGVKNTKTRLLLNLKEMY